MQVRWVVILTFYCNFRLQLRDCSLQIVGHKSAKNSPTVTLHDYNVVSASLLINGVTRAFPGGRIAHPEGQNEKEYK